MKIKFPIHNYSRIVLEVEPIHLILENEIKYQMSTGNKFSPKIMYWHDP